MDYTQPSCLWLKGIVLYEHYSVWNLVLFSDKPHIIMKDLATETACRGVNGQSRKDESPPAAPSIDACCGSWLRSIKLCLPVEYKDEMVRFLKLAGPVVRLSSDASQLS